MNVSVHICVPIVDNVLRERPPRLHNSHREYHFRNHSTLFDSIASPRYDFFKSYLLCHGVPFTPIQLQDNLLLHTIASSLAGTVATSM